jgi:hypothetical protein
MNYAVCSPQSPITKNGITRADIREMVGTRRCA